MRKSIDGLAAIVQEQFQLNPFSKTLYLFCEKRRDRLKAMLWEGNGFVLLYKRLENGNFKWPRCENEVGPITWQQFRWLMEGLELEYIPAQLQIVRYVRMSYECPKCKHTDQPYFQKANTPTSLINNSLASPSSVAKVIYQKYVNSIPLYRQEKDWEQLGIALSLATMANWIIWCSQDYLMLVTGYLRKELLERDILHCDETSVRVLKKDGKKPQTKSYM